MISPYNQAPPASGFLSTEEEDQNFPEEYQNFPHSQNYYDCHTLIILYLSSIGRLLKKIGAIQWSPDRIKYTQDPVVRIEH